MLRDIFKPARNIFLAMSIKQRSWTLVISLIFLLVVGGVINLAPWVNGWAKLGIFVLFIIFAIIFLLLASLRYSEDQQESEVSYQPNETNVHIPPKPIYPPIVSNEANAETEDEPLNSIMKKILNRLDADALKEEQRAESERKAAEAKAQLLLDKTVYIDDPPEIIYYLLHGLWRTLLALVVCILLVVVFVNIAYNSQEPRWWIGVVVVIPVFIWYTIRCYGDWAWTRRQIIGNQVVVQEPANGLFFMFGGKYSVSILDCGNVVVRKTWYERLLRLPSATVSIDTRLKDKEKGDSADAIVDVFKTMKNTRDPEKFRETIIRRHDELTLGQPGIMRRFDQ